MRKLFILMMAFLLPVSALEMRADETKVDKILIRVDRKGKLSRDVDADEWERYDSQINNTPYTLIIDRK